MQIGGIGASNLGAPSQPAVGGAKGGGGFGEMLEQMFSDLNSTSQNATNAVGGLASGQDVDIHQVMLATEMESLSFSLALQVRNKVVDAYHEIMRMPI